MFRYSLIAFLCLYGLTAHAEYLPPRADAGLITVEQLLEKGKYTQALSALEPVMKRHPENADAHVYMGYALLKLEDYTRAKRYFDRALQYDPRHLAAHQMTGEYYLATGKTEQALEQLQAMRMICHTGGCAEQIQLETAINRAKRN